MDNFNDIIPNLQALFGPVANQLAFSTGFRKRVSKLGGAELAYALVGGWLADPQASRSDLAALAQVSKQALDQSLTQSAADFLKSLLEWCVSQAIGAAGNTTSLISRFQAVYVLDSSTISLPAALASLWPGCGSSPSGGGGGSEAGVKVHVALDLVHGTLLGPQLSSARTHDRSGPHQELALEAGSLRIADLGYFKLGRLRELDQAAQRVYFLSRVPAGTQVYRADGSSVGIGGWLSELPAAQNSVDQKVQVGKTERLTVRLIAQRVSTRVQVGRQAGFKQLVRKRQRPVSEEQIRLSYWTVYITNVESSRLSLAEAHVLYRLRWQIELLFKLWKSEGEIDQWHSLKEWAVLCELYAKVIGAVVQHWLLVKSVWGQAEASLIKASRVIRQRTYSWVRWLKDWLHFGASHRAKLELELEQLVQSLAQGYHLDRAKAQPSSAQLLLHPPDLNLLDLN